MQNTEPELPKPAQRDTRQEAGTTGSERVLQPIPLLLGALSVCAGGAVLVGWVFGPAFLRGLLPGWGAMKANTALAFILAGMGLLASSLPPATLPVRLARLCALFCGLIGLLTLGEYLLAWNPGFDQWLISAPVHAVGTSHPSRMAPDSAACFVLLAAELMLACGPRKTTMRFWLTTILGSLIMAVALTVLLTYFTKTITTFGVWGRPLMATPTATLFLLLSTGMVRCAWPKGVSLESPSGRAAMGFGLWSLLVIGSLSWGLHQQGHHLLESATVAARANVNKDIGFRKWGASHGGVYVPPTERTPPNPYLKIPHRDVVTANGQALTLMNPAYMLREMQQNFGDEYGTRCRITSLKPLNPANAADPWQAKALAGFARGDQELLEAQYLNDQPYLRLIRPFIVEANCLNCHAHQGYKLGDVRGGIDSSIPLGPFLERAMENSTTLALSHAVIWLLGISSLLLFSRREHFLDAENQRAVAALGESEERFRLAAETANDLVYEWDLQEGVLWSGRVDEMLGYGVGEFPRTMTGWAESLHPEDHDRVLAAVQAHLAGKAPYAAEYRIRKKDGEYQWWSARGATIKTPEGTPLRWIGTVTDITERKEAEEEKLKLESQLRQAQKMEAIGTLAGGIAHDFNNILSIIFGYNELAMEEKDPENRRHHLEELQRGAQRAKELVSQILAFSRKAEQQKQPLQVSLIIKEALKMLRASIPTTIEIRQDIASNGLVLADPTQIHQVIMNLCTNAYHAMRETGGILAVSLDEVKIGAEDYGYANLSPGNYLKLAISDTGCGIEPKIQEKIFEPYFTTKKAGEGTGMGLAVVHGIVKSHHGHITVYSELGKGTSFHVYLPLTAEEAAPLADEKEPEELRGKGERILLVDDEEQIGAVIDAILSKNGYQVTTFADGVQALEEFRKNPEQFDLVITDMTMPSITGTELARKIMALRPKTPVILCTGQSELINREKALAMGICDYLTKPLLTEPLLVAVKKAFEKG
ncbi:MAG: PAS domain-containing protein [Desulfurivibrionaceae bacterium]